MLKQSFDVQPLIQKQADCIHVMTYNEYGQLLDAGYKPEDLTVFNYSELGENMLEDGLYAKETDLKDPAFQDKMVRFVKASMQGWKYAVENPDEAAYARTAKMVLDQKIVTKEPAGAWTHDITDKAM